MEYGEAISAQLRAQQEYSECLHRQKIEKYLLILHRINMIATEVCSLCDFGCDANCEWKQVLNEISEVQHEIDYFKHIGTNVPNNK